MSYPRPATLGVKLSLGATPCQQQNLKITNGKANLHEIPKPNKINTPGEACIISHQNFIVKQLSSARLDPQNQIDPKNNRSQGTNKKNQLIINICPLLQKPKGPTTQDSQMRVSQNNMSFQINCNTNSMNKISSNYNNSRGIHIKMKPSKFHL